MNGTAVPSCAMIFIPCHVLDASCRIGIGLIPLTDIPLSGVEVARMSIADVAPGPQPKRTACPALLTQRIT